MKRKSIKDLSNHRESSVIYDVGRCLLHPTLSCAFNLAFDEL